ncbi:MAG: hypothetical protein ACFFBC_11220 [Promethearchaeota archaeon]
MPKTTDKTFGELILDKFGADEGQKLIDEINSIESEDDKKALEEKYKNEGKVPPIHVVWGAEY